MSLDQRPLLLAKSALHLRRGGMLLAAADFATGQRLLTLERKGMQTVCSVGLPTLARKVSVPVVTALAVWQDKRINIRFEAFDSPYAALQDDEWNQNWLERYWDTFAKVLESQPENLRFLRHAVEEIARPWEAVTTSTTESYQVGGIGGLQ